MDETVLLVVGSFVLLACLVAGLGALTWWAYRNRTRIRRHRPGLEELARNKALRFSDDPAFSSSHPGLEQVHPISLGTGSSTRVIANSLSGEIDGRPSVILLLQHVAGTGKHRRDRYYTLLATSVGDRIPAFLLTPRPTGFEARVEKFASTHPTPDDVRQIENQIELRRLEFPDHPEFARRFRVAGPEPGRIAALFRSEVVSHLAVMREDCVLSCAAAWLVVGVPRHVAPGEIDRFLAESGAVRDLLAPRASREAPA